MDSVVERVSLILKARNLSPSKFADEIGVQRSSISHIMSGRNKPSLDFIMKILNTYNDISAEWLLKGQESLDLDIVDQKITTEEKKSPSVERKKEGRKAVKVLIFYDDKSFEEIISEV